MKVENLKIEKEIKDLELNIVKEKNRIESERKKKEQIEREKKILALKSSIDGSYKVGEHTCTIKNGKITWSAGKSYNNIVYEGEVYGNKYYEEYTKDGYFVGEFVYYQDYSKGTYVRKDGKVFNVTKILY